jgi:hypothetical protein
MRITVRNSKSGRVIAYGVSVPGENWKQALLRLYQESSQPGSQNWQIGAILVPGLDRTLASDTWVVTLVYAPRGGRAIVEDVVVETDPPQR